MWCEMCWGLCGSFSPTMLNFGGSGLGGMPWGEGRGSQLDLYSWLYTTDMLDTELLYS